MGKKISKKKLEQFTDFEETLIIGAIRYYMGRQTIVSATFPTDFITNNYHKRLSQNMLSVIIRDLKEHRKMFKAFGDSTIDDPVWLKFQTYLECFQKDSFLKLKLIDNSECEAFVCKINQRVWDRDENGNPIGDSRVESLYRVYPRDRYETSPYHEIYIPVENILSGYEIKDVENAREV